VLKIRNRLKIKKGDRFLKQAHHADTQSWKNDEDNPSQNQSRNQNRKKVWLVRFAISIDYFPIDNAIISFTRK
jgi:hypothetical protein